jgi:hypothetical protein
VSLHEKFSKAWRRLSAPTTSGDHFTRIKSQLSSTLNRIEPLLARA